VILVQITVRFSGPVPKINHFKNSSSPAPLQPMVRWQWILSGGYWIRAIFVSTIARKMEGEIAC